MMTPAEIEALCARLRFGVPPDALRNEAAAALEEMGRELAHRCEDCGGKLVKGELDRSGQEWWCANCAKLEVLREDKKHSRERIAALEAEIARTIALIEEIDKHRDHLEAQCERWAQENARLLDALVGMVNQHCQSDGKLDSMALSDNAEAMHLLNEMGLLLEFDDGYGRRCLAGGIDWAKIEGRAAIQRPEGER